MLTKDMKIATPPSRGIAVSWILRSPGSMTPVRSARALLRGTISAESPVAPPRACRRGGRDQEERGETESGRVRRAPEGPGPEEQAQEQRRLRNSRQAQPRSQ